MRWLLLAAVALVVALLLLFWRDDGTNRREAQRQASASKDKSLRKHQNTRGQTRGAGAETNGTEVFDWDNAGKAKKLPPKGYLTFEVCFEDGTPAEGATVTQTWNPVQPDVPGTQSATTDKAGIARLRAVAITRWFHARRGALVSGPTRLVPSPGGPHKLQLGEAHDIGGVVLRPDGSPAAGARLRINFWDGVERRFIEGKTAKDGAFDAIAVPWRWTQRMRIEVRAEGVPRNRFRWDGPRTDLRLQLTSEDVRGRVVHENGKPAANVLIDTGERPLRADEDGRFETALQRREGAVILVKRAARVLHVRVLKAAEREVEIVLRPGRPLPGRLLTHDRKPVAGARVDLSVPAGRHVAKTGTLRDGEFRFQSVAEGRYTLRVRFRGTPETDYRVEGVRTGERLETVLPKQLPAQLRLMFADGTRVPGDEFFVIVTQEGRTVLWRRLRRVGASKNLEFAVWKKGPYGVLVAKEYRAAKATTRLLVTEAGPNVFDITFNRPSAPRDR